MLVLVLVLVLGSLLLFFASSPENYGPTLGEKETQRAEHEHEHEYEHEHARGGHPLAVAVVR